MKLIVVRILWVVLLTIIAIGSLIVLFGLRPILVEFNFPIGRIPEEEAFKRFFSTRPSSIEVLEYGGRRYTLGGGSYALVFRISEAELQRFLEKEGFKRLDIQNDLAGWSLESVITSITRLIKWQISIKPSFDWYEKKTEVTAARVFYDREKTLAVFLGEGRYPK